jgi:hypothetical protein
MAAHFVAEGSSSDSDLMQADLNLMLSQSPSEGFKDERSFLLCRFSRTVCSSVRSNFWVDTGSATDLDPKGTNFQCLGLREELAKLQKATWPVNS